MRPEGGSPTQVAPSSTHRHEPTDHTHPRLIPATLSLVALVTALHIWIWIHCLVISESNTKKVRE
eukprot:m.200125 g.200125  ORF g.200125 m.200125 type:complete len:65 (-) comp25196_c1_seq2:1152-1346(-)